MRKKYLVLFFIVAIVCVGIGICIGLKIGEKKVDNTELTNENNIINYKSAYVKGWAYFFTKWGTNGVGAQYINQFNYGRNYDYDFENLHDAFIEGYRDGNFYVNHDDTEKFLGNAESGYDQYYKNEKENLEGGTSLTFKISYNNPNETQFNGTRDYGNCSYNFLYIIRSKKIRDDILENYNKKIDIFNDIDIVCLDYDAVRVYSPGIAKDNGSTYKIFSKYENDSEMLKYIVNKINEEYYDNYEISIIE